MLNQIQKQRVAILFSEFYRSKDQKYYKNRIKESVFVCILSCIFYGVSRAIADLQFNV